MLTPYPAVNDMLALLVPGIRRVLGDQLIALYLDGSLANGGFDEASDIDFVAVTRDEPSEALFQALKALHADLAAVDSPWAIQIEGSYISQRAIRRCDPAYSLYPNIERGEGEALKWAVHDAMWNVHRAILLQCGITLFGPDPRALIDPVTPEMLRQAMRPVLLTWARGLHDDSSQIASRGYQSYIVLTLCRVGYTLQTGTVASKIAALRWAQEKLPARWSGLIERAWQSRLRADFPLDPADVQETLHFIEFMLANAGSG